MSFPPNAGSGGGGSFVINDAHFFDDDTERDAYFATHADEQIVGTLIKVGTEYQQWDGSSWTNVTAIVTGPKGDPGTDADNIWGTITGTLSNQTDLNNALGSKIPTSQKGAASGVAELNESGVVPSDQLPSYVDDVVEYANYAALPVMGSGGTIYFTIDDGKQYRWGGTTYIEIVSGGVTLGETSDTAYRGDRGKIAYDHSQTTHAPSNAQKNSDILKSEIEAKLTGEISTHSHAGTGTHASSHVTGGSDVIANAVAGGASGLMSGSDKTKLDGIASGANNYSLPTATDSVLGGVKVGSGITITDGVISVSDDSGGFSEYVKWTLEGVVYESTLLYWVAEEACTINLAKVHASSNPSATGSYIKVQIMKNGLMETDSIFSADQAIQITETTTPVNGIYTGSGTLDSGQVSLAAGDVIWARINQADTGAADLRVAMKVTYT